MRISKKVREEAATALSMAACGTCLLATACFETDLGYGTTSRRLAFAALTHVVNNHKIGGSSAYAEAEALIRTGWSPGDEP